jgi:hypothetical protein
LFIGQARQFGCDIVAIDNAVRIGIGHTRAAVGIVVASWDDNTARGSNSYFRRDSSSSRLLGTFFLTCSSYLTNKSEIP